MTTSRITMLAPRLPGSPIVKTPSTGFFEGTTTFHFSIHPSIHSPLDLHNLYHLVISQPVVWSLVVGKNGDYVEGYSDYLRLESSNGTCFKTKWGKDTWYNFAITTNWVNGWVFPLTTTFNLLTNLCSHSTWSAQFSLGNENLRKVCDTAHFEPVKHMQMMAIGLYKLVNPAYNVKTTNEGIFLGGLIVKQGGPARNW